MPTWRSTALHDPWWIEEPRRTAVAPDGRWAIVVGASEVALFSVPSGARLASIHAFLAVPAVSPDSQRFALHDQQRHCVAVWAATPPREEACLGPLEIPVFAFSPAGDEIAMADGHGIVRWSIPTGDRVWQTSSPLTGLDWIAWPVEGTVVIGGTNGASGFDAATGQQRWQLTQGVPHYVGSWRGDAIVAGQFYAGRASGSLARLELSSGKLRDLTGNRDDFPDQGVLLDDDTAVVIDGRFVAHRYRIGGSELARFALPPPEYGGGIAAQRDGRFALVLSGRIVVPWDFRAGQPIEIPGVQLGAILAIDADRNAVVSAAADGSIAMRRPDGGLIVQHRTRAAGCRAWAVDVPSRRALCAVDLGRNASASDPTHEWLDLDSGQRGNVRGPVGEVVAIDGSGTAWTAGYGYAAWIPAALDERVSTTGPSPISIGTQGETPRWARIVTGGRAVAFGGAEYHPPFESSNGGWSGLGLWMMGRDGALNQLDDGLGVYDLATDRAGDRLALATIGGLEVWDLRAPSGAWSRRWSRVHAKDDWHTPPQVRPVVALSPDGALAAVTRDSGRTIAVHDAASGAPIAAFDTGASERVITALAFDTRGAIYAGTSTGRMLALQLHR